MGSKSVTPPMDKNATPSTRRSVRRLGMKSNVMMFQNKTVGRFLSRNAARSQRRMPRYQLSALSAGSCQRLQREAKKTLCLSSQHQNQGGVHAGMFHHQPACL